MRTLTRAIMDVVLHLGVVFIIDNIRVGGGVVISGHFGDLKLVSTLVPLDHFRVDIQDRRGGTFSIRLMVRVIYHHAT